MSGLAKILLQENFKISGSDAKPSPLTEQLKAMGACVFYGQSAKNLSRDIAAVVYTAAIQKDNEELCEAKRLQIPLLSRAELLGQMMANYDVPVAVAGTHGKTTTTSMLSHILLSSGKKPTISVGGILKAIGGNVFVGESEIFVTEACEYTNSFLHFSPKIGVILNIDADHLDFFKDLADIRSSFRRFASLLPADGALVINGEIPLLEEITRDLTCKVITFGLTRESLYRAENISFDSLGNVSFDARKGEEALGRIALSVKGRHNACNALAALACAALLKIPFSSVQKGLRDFTGTDRRFEYKGRRNGFTIVDDYAHHPAEIRATLECAANYPRKELWCVFQPHTYTRTKTLFGDFIEALLAADHVILTDIYAARETDTLGVSSAKLWEALKEKGCDAYYIPDFKEVENFLLSRCQEGDLLITMGAGDVSAIGNALLEL